VAAQAQVNLSSVTVRLGAIRTLQTKTDDGGHLWALYPELQVGGVLFTPSVSWGLSWGYWDDGLNQAINWMDYTTMSQNGHIIALRAAFEPQKADSHAPIPLKIFAGLAEHIIFDHYIGGAGVNGAHLPDSTYYSTTLCAGLSLAFPLSSLLQLEAEAEQFFPFTSGRYGDAEKGRRNFKLGVVFNF
jgi:hypothetical protein